MSQDSDRRIGVIGGGLAGLAAACTLAARGHAVVLFERNPMLGGRVAELAAEGFRFDLGPTRLTFLPPLGHVFAEAGQYLHDAVAMVALSPHMRCFFADGSTLDLTVNPAQTAETLQSFATDSRCARAYRRCVALARPRGDAPCGGLRWPWLMRHALRALQADPRVAQTVRLGLERTAAEECWGVWHPLGGLAAVPQALERLARERGVEVRPNTGVRRVRVNGGAVAGVETDAGDAVPLAAVVVADGSGGKPEAVVTLCLGLHQAYDHLLHHSVAFAADPREEAACLERQGEPAPDPTCHLTAPSLTDPDAAPPGGEALRVQVRVPPGLADWPERLPAYRRVVLDKLARTAGLTDLEQRLAFEAILPPQDRRPRLERLEESGRGRVRGMHPARGAAVAGLEVPCAVASGLRAVAALEREWAAGTPRRRG